MTEQDKPTQLDLWKHFQAETGYFENTPPDPSRRFCMDDYPGPYKSYDDAIKTIALDHGAHAAFSAPIGRVFCERRSKRNFLEGPLNLEELSFLLWATQGITADMERYQLRTAPSAGALYPCETYLAVRAVEGLEPGVWHYNVKDASLELIREGEVAEETCRASGDQIMVELAAVNFLWTGILQRTCCKYYERGFRYMYEDVGHLSAYLQLAATALDKVGCAVIGSFYDDRTARLLGVDPEVEPVLMMGSVGRVTGGDFKEDRRAYMEKYQERKKQAAEQEE